MSVQALLDRGRAAFGRGDPQQALAFFTRCLELDPGNVAALNNRGLLLGHLGRADGALACFEQALQRDPTNIVALVNGGIALAHLGHSAQAIEWYDQAIAVDAGHAEAWMCRGSALLLLQRPEEALECFNAVLQIDPRHIDAYGQLGRTLEVLGRSIEAEVCRAEALNYQHRFPEALPLFDRLVAARPQHAGIRVGRAVALAGLARDTEALDDLERALRVEPELPFALSNRACLRLAQGHLREGFRDMEVRWKIPPFSRQRLETAAPLWLGATSLEGQRILVHHEQGLGDTLQFVRYVPLLARLGAQVLLRLPAPLLELMRSVEGVADLIPSDAALPAHDFHCPIMSLPLAFGTTLETIPSRIPYLRADAERIRRWGERLGARRRRRVGLVWAGRHRPPINYARDLPLRALRPLLELDIEFVSLQVSVSPSDAGALSQLSRIARHGESLTDFADTAALIEHLDLVIAVDTSVVHLAGAMGKPIWVLNRYAPCWRWLRQREDSPWYPTARLFNQLQFGDWTGVIERVHMALAQAR